MYNLHQGQGIDLELTAFLVDRQARGLSAGSLDFYRQKLSYLCHYLRGQSVNRLEAATPGQLRTYLLSLIESHNPGGVHACFRAMRTLYRWHWAEHDLDAPNPIAKVKAKLPQEMQTPLDLDALRAMLATCKRRTFTGDRDRAAMLALLDTGCRASEFTGLDVRDVNQETGAVLIRQGKGGKSRVTFLGAKTRRELARYLRRRGQLTPDAPLWATDTGERLAYHGLRSFENSFTRLPVVVRPG